MRFLVLIIIIVIGTTQIIAGQSMSASSAGAIFPRTNDINTDNSHSNSNNNNIRPKRRLYGMCPPQFHRIGEQCYLLSDEKSNWLEAHFFCKDKNSKLAEPAMRSDKHLRKFLQHHDNSLDKDVIWLGATYDWHNDVWQWSISGKNLTYDPFSPKDPGTNKPLDNHCAVYDPQFGYGWSARSCPDRHRFICEHKMPKVSEQNRRKVYDRWNQTYPNEFANEVLLNVHDAKRLTRRGKAITDNDHFYQARRSPKINTGMDVYMTLRPHRKSENDIDFPHDHSVSATEYPKQFAKFSTILANEIEGNSLVEKSTEASGQMHVQPRRKYIRKRIKSDLKFEHQREKERKRQQKLIERQQKQQERERKLLERKVKKEERQKRLRQESERMQQQQQQESDVREEAGALSKTPTISTVLPPRLIPQQLQNEDELSIIEHEREQRLREQEKQRRLVDEANRRSFEMREKERLEELKRQEELEEQRRAFEREQNMQKLATEEQARLLEEAQKRAEKEKERDDIISRRNKEAEDQEAEEKRQIEEVRRLEDERKREHERKIKEEEEANRQKELEIRQKQEMEVAERREKLEKRARAEKIRKMAERISKLSPEAQREFLEMRKKRKFKKNQQQDAQNQS